MENTARKLATLITVDTKELKEALTFLKNVTVGQPLIPLHLKAENNKLILVARDRLASAQITLNCSGDLPETVLAFAPTYANIKNMKTPSVVTFDGMTFATCSLRIPATIVEDGPSTFHIGNEANWKGEWHVSARESKAWAQELLTVIVQDSLRNYGSVAHIGTDKIVGTDGFRLTYIDQAIPADLQNIGIPAKTLKIIGKLKDDSVWSVSEDGNTLRIQTQNTDLLCRTSAVKFPNYTGILPKEGTALNVPVCAGELKSLLTTADKSCTIKIAAENGKLTFSTVGASFSVDVEGYATMPERTINGKFLLDTLKHTKESTFCLRFPKNIGDPLEIRLTSHTTIIVPMK